jgi:SAM-dependent methyltransferase
MQWAIPEPILSKAPESPWTHFVEKFTVRSEELEQTPSVVRAREALSVDATELSVLDVGCGGGRATYALVPPATHVVGVDQQAAMLAAFVTESLQRGVAQTTVHGSWPSVSRDTPVCDVVVCHHVLYNVSNLEPFIMALDGHARRRVVIELTELHPLSSTSDAWKHFWSIERPSSPTANHALAAIRSLGLQPKFERFQVNRERSEVTESDVRQLRIQLCLGAERDEDIKVFLASRIHKPRELATIWWDVTRSS